MYLAFKKSLRSMRERITDGVESIAWFNLQFAVETHIYDIRPLIQSSAGCKILGVTLRTFAASIIDENNDSPFIEIY